LEHMRDRSAIRYSILAILFLVVGANLAGNLWWVTQKLLSPATSPKEAVTIMMGTRTLVSGELRLDEVQAINGRKFQGYREWAEAWRVAKPGDKIRLTLREPSGKVIEPSLLVPDASGDYATPSGIALTVASDIVVPIVAILLGFGVVLIRPRDRNAWILLCLMISFAEVSRNSQWFGLGYTATVVWGTFWSMTWPVWMLLFGIGFPHRLPLDGRRPWLKFLLVGPLVGIILGLIGIVAVWHFNIDAALPWHGVLVSLFRMQLILGMTAIGGFFACLGIKGAIEKSPDARRRLRILQTGTGIALTPMLGSLLYGMVQGRELFVGVPWPIVVTVLLMLGTFPLTLAYVIVVGRAMDLSFVIRQSVRYGLARGLLWVVRAALAVAGIGLFITASRGGLRLVDQVRIFAVGISLLVFRQRWTDKASQWVDRRFFREAYDAETVLGELASEAGHYMEIAPLLETVSRRLSDTLHVEDVVVLLSEGNQFVSRFSVQGAHDFAIPTDGRLAARLLEERRPLEVCPADMPPTEQETLVAMKTQLLAPLVAKGRLNGILSLGPKRSEAPWTPTDLRLLGTIASQMALAVENGRLLLSLAAEAAEREKANREIEIAKEVQERLFPQKFPQLPGLDCAGFCRPARGIGGDYYDFLDLGNDRLGIAIGDVSGKGIPAALLMASLQASLRGQAMAQVADLGILMNNVNKLVYDASSSSRYATFFYGEYDINTRYMRFVNAGHNPPIILRGNEVVRLEAGGPVVGLLAGARYVSDECTLQAGDIFIGFTDGISEAMNERDEEWEEERFIAAALAVRNKTGREIIDATFVAADAFTGQAKQYDDMTLLVVRLG
jgi:sigma-B regulation protein RsbU (phosphoserine phosphatase)